MLSDFQTETRSDPEVVLLILFIYFLFYFFFHILNLAEHGIFCANNMKMPTIVGSFIFISRDIFMLTMLRKKVFATVNNLRFIAGHISCSAEFSKRKKKFFFISRYNVRQRGLTTRQPL